MFQNSRNCDVPWGTNSSDAAVPSASGFIAQYKRPQPQNLIGLIRVLQRYTYQDIQIIGE
jgi:hypothetical protein